MKSIEMFKSYFDQSSDENKLLIMILAIMGSITLIISLVNLFLHTSNYAYLGFAFVLLNYLAIYLLYRSILSFNLTSEILLFSLFALVVASFMYTPSKAQAAIYLVSFPITLIFLRPSSEWKLWMVLFAFVIILSKSLDYSVTQYSWVEMAQVGIALGVLSIILALYVSFIQNSKIQLALQKSKLSDVNGDLEARVKERTLELERTNEQLLKDLNMDTVTNIMNKRAFLSKLREAILRFQEDKTPFSIVQFDLDHFQHVNHRYGRKVGDEILEKIAKMAAQNSRLVDIVARVSGDEFAILMHNTLFDDAFNIAEMIRKKIEWAVFLDDHHITASFGVVEIASKQDEHTIMHHLDLAVQRAKHKGRNHVSKLEKEDLYIPEMA